MRLIAGRTGWGYGYSQGVWLFVYDVRGGLSVCPLVTTKGLVVQQLRCLFLPHPIGCGGTDRKGKVVSDKSLC